MARATILKPSEIGPGKAAANAAIRQNRISRETKSPAHWPGLVFRLRWTDSQTPTAFTRAAKREIFRETVLR